MDLRIRPLVRSLLRNPGTTALHLIGLGVGLAASLLIIAHVSEDLRWDSFHNNGDRIYRLLQHMTFTGSDPATYASTQPAIAPAVVSERPEFETGLRMIGGLYEPLSIGEESYFQGDIYFVDDNFFQFFDFPLLFGDPSTALANSNCVVLNRQLARQYFGDINPIGKTIVFEDEFPMQVSAVVDDPPAGSHIEFDMLMNFDAFVTINPWAKNEMESWGWFNFTTYFTLAEGVSQEQAEIALRESIEEHYNWEEQSFSLLPLRKIHFGSYGHSSGDTSLRDMAGLVVLGMVLLLIAVINYINLATAQSLRRSKEVGLRKVIGAQRSQLMARFVAESLMLTALAGLFALLMVWLAEPWFEQFTRRQVDLSLSGTGHTGVALLLLVAVVGLMAGLYPAFVLSGFRPTNALKEVSSRGKSGLMLRRSLVVVQFASTIILVVATIFIYRQLEFARKADFGFSRDNVIVIPTYSTMDFWDHYETLSTRLDELPEVSSYTLISGIPGRLGTYRGVLPDDWNGEEWMAQYVSFDFASLDVFGLRMVEGRFFSKEHSEDKFEVGGTASVILNEAAVKMLGWDNPLSHTIKLSNNTVLNVIGVVQDFQQGTLHESIEPMVLFDEYQSSNRFAIRFQTDDIAGFVNGLEGIWFDIYPGSPCVYNFLDDTLNGLYEQDVRQGKLLRLFSGITLLIALLGLLGLVSLSTLRRRREIGVRKVFGASEPQLVSLLAREFLMLVGIANAIAWPLAWILIKQQNAAYAYRPEYAWWAYPAAGVGTLMVASLAVLVLTWRASRQNPASVLRHE